jgi:NAD+ kinase
MKRILILPNPLKPKALEFTVKLTELISRYGFIPVLERETAHALNLADRGTDLPENWNGIDLVIVLGGDGAILNVARRVYPYQVPLLGINMGQLGFLTKIEIHQVKAALDDLRAGKYQFEVRAMLEAEVFRNGQFIERFVGLNDLVVAKNASARMIRIETWIDGKYFTTYPADGLIVATATGSTAYSLSAGGPILDPRLEAILITPICAHSLYARPVVLDGEVQVRVILDANHTDINLTVDGQIETTLQPGDHIDFRRAPHHTKLVNFETPGIFEVLKSHLGEGRI